MKTNKTQILRMITENKWVLVGMNHDEDLHFSSLYVRGCTKKYSKVFSYDKILAFYDNFNESYYIDEEECEKIANEVLSKLKTNPEWMINIIKNIYARSDDLEKVFSDYKITEDFSSMTNDELLKLHRNHYKAHWELYQVALIPEALDRGLNVFTKYLFEYLRKTCNIKVEEKLNESFNILTSPLSPSIFQSSIFDLNKLVQENYNDVQSAIKSKKRFYLAIKPILLEKLNDYRSKWGFIKYHGYGKRKLPELCEYIELMEDITNEKYQFRHYKDFDKFLIKNKLKREKIVEQYNVDILHQKLFAIYAKIGLSKLYRRFIQLKNFYFLDKLVNHISCRTNVVEGVVRSLLPEEVMDLVNNKIFNENYNSRLEACLYVINGMNEQIFSGDEARILHYQLKSIMKLRINILKEKALYGVVASTGYVKGICRVIIRQDDAIEKNFRNGDIIVSESTDPDLIDLMSKAGGIITQSGGVTCHAAITSREFGKPTIVGVEHLLNLINDGDEVILDANRGKITIVSKTQKDWKYLHFPDGAIPSDFFGNKFHNLCRIMSIGIKVPQMIVIETKMVTEIWNDRSKKTEFLNEVEEAIKLLNCKKVIIRSSYCVENGFLESKAGQFSSMINVDVTKMIKNLEMYIETNLTKNINLPLGSIIIQEMILGEFSGVCFTSNPIVSNQNEIILEIVKGINYPLTNGIEKPDIFLQINKEDLDIISREDRNDILIELGWQNIIELIEVCKRIEKHFCFPQDIEWTIAKGKIFILQSRPISSIHKKHVAVSVQD